MARSGEPTLSFNLRNAERASRLKTLSAHAALPSLTSQQKAPAGALPDQRSPARDHRIQRRGILLSPRNPAIPAQRSR
jgi:hypothetical protein